MNEPPNLEPRFRTLTRRRSPGTKDRADSYLAAFAASGELGLVTSLRGKTKPLILPGV